VSISRPFAVGQVTGAGWLFIRDGVLTLQGAWPFPGPGFVVMHTDHEVEVQIQRLVSIVCPWVAVATILHDEKASVVANLPLWRRRSLIDLLEQNGYTPRVRKLWFGSATWRARRWLMSGYAEPKW
jgi:hypothetical protein